MNRHILTTRPVGRIALLLTSSLVLFGCSTDPAALGAEGTPSLSLNAPLTAVACTSSGVCITLGASGAVRMPTTAAQIRNHRGAWSRLNTPEAPLATFVSASCATNMCYFGGAKSSGELLWAINANNGHIRSVAGPPGGLALRNLSCTSDNDCAAIDTTINHLVRLSHSTNAGATWSAPRTLRWASDGASALNCVSVTDCFVSSTSPAHAVTLRHTLNGGATWRVVTTPPSWRSLTSLQCATGCTALITTGAGSFVATLGKTGPWHQTALSFHAAALSCASTTLCLAVGYIGVQTPTMSQWIPGAARHVTLTYVPSPLTGVACQPEVCVAIGVTTVVALRP